MNQSLELAQALKKAGLAWEPTKHDFFMVPDAGLDDHVFVLSDLMAQLEILKGWPSITFNGVAEWALDFVLVTEAVWLPTEAQLRDQLERLLAQVDNSADYLLRRNGKQYQCEFSLAEEPLIFKADSVSQAYGHACLALLDRT